MNTKLKLLTIYLFAIFAGMISSTTAVAQMRAGIKGGLNVSNLYIDEVDDENARYGFNVGVYGQLLSSDVFAIQPELLFSTKGTKAEYGGSLFDQTVKFNLSYLDLPVLAVFKLGESAEIHVGPYVSYLLNANISHDGDLGSGVDDLDRDNFKSFDYGLSGGFGLNFGNFQVGARYNYGLAKIADDNDAEIFLGDSKNSVAQLYVAFNLAKEE
ncbi:MAG TPA: porin family protein [Chryseolinea sp.]|nr:porin family protein [Chryseolinea sp.]